MQLIGLLDSPYMRRVAVPLRLCGMAFEHAALSVFRHQEEMCVINHPQLEKLSAYCETLPAFAQTPLE
jgi:glutathione S-transferase